MRSRLVPSLRTLLFALVALAPLAGCEETPTQPDRVSLPIMPLAVGNMWIGRSYGLDTLGGAIDIEADTLSIVSTESIAAETWYRTSDGTLLANRADGLWWRSSSTALATLIAKHPASVGEIFGRETARILYPDTLDHEIDSLVYGHVVIAVGTRLTVTAGTYDVNGYQEHLETFDGQVITEDHELWMGDQEFYSPGVGRVQQRRYQMTPDGKTQWGVWELVEARLK